MAWNSARYQGHLKLAGSGFDSGDDLLSDLATDVAFGVHNLLLSSPARRCSRHRRVTVILQNLDGAVRIEDLDIHGLRLHSLSGERPGPQGREASLVVFYKDLDIDRVDPDTR